MTLSAIDQAGLSFFTELGGRLRIELTEPSRAVSEQLVNQVASPTARIAGVSFEMYAFVNDEIEDLSEEQWLRVVLRSPQIRMRDIRTPDTCIEAAAPNGTSFTVRDLDTAIERTELHCRASSNWLDGIDVHHVYFEGMTLGSDGVWEVHWGS